MEYSVIPESHLIFLLCIIFSIGVFSGYLIYWYLDTHTQAK